MDQKRHGDKFVIQQPVTFQNKRYFNLHRLLRAIDHNVLLSKLPQQANASQQETFVTPDELFTEFRQYPSVVMNTYKVIDACTIEMEYTALPE